MTNIYIKDFPILKRKINGKRLAYLDNAATSQMPKQVLDAVYEFDSMHRANVHRGLHTLSEEATNIYEDARKKVAKFINAVVPEEVVFVSNTTDAINFVAYGWARKNLKKGDIILVSSAEHHSNLVPWQLCTKEASIDLAFIPINREGELDIKNTQVDWSKVRLVAIPYVSNVIGVVNNIKDIVKFIKKKVNDNEHLPKILIDGAQSVPHMPTNVQKMGIDFLVFSGHKMCGPMGIGVLWINRDIVDELGEYKTGGGMIKEVTEKTATYSYLPERFEAGTPNVSGAVGLAAACEYLSKIGLDKIHETEMNLMKYSLSELLKIDDVIIYGTKDYKKRSGLLAFNIKNIPSHDLAAIVDTEGVAIRSGHHCVMPWHKKQEITTTARLSLYFYNTKEDIDALISGINKAKKLFMGVH